MPGLVDEGRSYLRECDGKDDSGQLQVRRYAAVARERRACFDVAFIREYWASGMREN